MAQEPECKAPCSRNTSRGEVIGPEWQRGFASTSLHSREVIGPEWRGALLQPRGQDKGSASTLHLTQNQTGLCFNLVGNRALLQPCCRDKGSASTLHHVKKHMGSLSSHRSVMADCGDGRVVVHSTSQACCGDGRLVVQSTICGMSHCIISVVNVTVLNSQRW